MKFSNRDIRSYLLNKLLDKFGSLINFRFLSEEGEEINLNLEPHKSITTIVLDGRDENLFITFLGMQTSIFVFEQEIMFIDEGSKGTYTSSDVHGNVVYAGDLRNFSHEEILNLIYEFVDCFVGATDIEIIKKEINNSNMYKKYSDYETFDYIINVNNAKDNNTKTFENITIKCNELKK